VPTKLTIWLEDYPDRNYEDPVPMAINALEEDFRVLHWDIDFNIEITKND
jgi:hypothetical protein